MLRKMRELIGWTTGNGIFAPGGSISNLYGLMASRHDLFPDSKTRGCRHLPQLAVFTSTEVGQFTAPASLKLASRLTILWGRRPSCWGLALTMW